MCHITGIYHLRYPRSSGNFSVRLTLQWDRGKVIKLVGIPTPGLAIYSVGITLSWAVHISLIIIDTHVSLSNTVTSEASYHFFHLKYKETEPIITRKLHQKSTIYTMWSWDSTIEVTPNFILYSFHFPSPPNPIGNNSANNNMFSGNITATCKMGWYYTI